MLLKADASQPAYDDLSRVARVQSRRHGSARWIGSGRGIAEQDLRRAVPPDEAGGADPAHKAAQLALSRVLASQGNIEAAVRIPFDQLQANPADVPALEQLASILVGHR